LLALRSVVYTVIAYRIKLSVSLCVFRAPFNRRKRDPVDADATCIPSAAILG
jgi:hypothetical protein